MMSVDGTLTAVLGFIHLSVREHHVQKVRTKFLLKAPYSSKTDIFIQERFNKLINGINTIIKFGI